MPSAYSPERRQQLWSSCERFLSGHGLRRIPEELAALARAAPPDQLTDRYGSGGVVEQLERELCERFDKPAAVFLPSGTMAQQIALRIHAERSGCRSVAFHPTCHLELHEQRGYSRLHGLEACLVGSRTRLIARADLDALVEPVAALLLELPQREIGGQLPS
jgi:threonine aldolase